MRKGFSSVYIEDGIRKSCYALNNDTDEDNVYLVEMINGDRNNIKLDGKAVVIS